MLSSVNYVYHLRLFSYFCICRLWFSQNKKLLFADQTEVEFCKCHCSVLCDKERLGQSRQWPQWSQTLHRFNVWYVVPKAIPAFLTNVQAKVVLVWVLSLFHVLFSWYDVFGDGLLSALMSLQMFPFFLNMFHLSVHFECVWEVKSKNCFCIILHCCHDSSILLFSCRKITFVRTS